MAERRMFSKSIVLSDTFNDMPTSARCLYYTLGMSADDDGFVNNPKGIMKQCGVSQDDMNVLIARNYVLMFENGLIVIRDWRNNNYIRSDRKTPTKFQEELKQLRVDKYGSYHFNNDMDEIDCETVEEKNSMETDKRNIVVLEEKDNADFRKIAYKDSSLPYSFTYKMRRAFDGQICPVCGRKMQNTENSATAPTVQHNIPISKGGVHELENISIICLGCNVAIRNNTTDELNNSDVIKIWDNICCLEREGINWFSNPSILWNGRQATGICQASDRQVTGTGKDSIGKYSIGKDSIDNLIISKEIICPSKVEERVVSEWNKLKDIGIPPIARITSGGKRKKYLNTRINQYGIDTVLEAIGRIRKSDFLQGKNNKGWIVTFDWFILPSNFPKVLEGNYDNKEYKLLEQSNKSTEERQETVMDLWSDE
jgi:5-methylcytosine-specific restriction endonuclease McrA